MGLVRTSVAVMLLVVFGATAAYSATPLADGHCLCDHAPDAPCDCPHMHQAVMPCHRHHHLSPPRRARTGLSAHCGMSPHSLALLAVAPLPGPAPALLRQTERAVPIVFSPRACERFLDPPNPPPKLG